MDEESQDQLFAVSNRYLVPVNAPIEMSPYQRFIALSRYARYLPDEKRRETWEETVERYCLYMRTKFPSFPAQRMYDAIVNMRVMPSMRAIMTAGPALEQDQVASFNCAYLAIDDFRCFDEAMYILMCGCGVGFSVERQFIAKLPEVAEQFHDSTTVIHVEDSRIGWAQSFRQLISLLYAGSVPSWDVSALRQAGAPLRTFGGRSSGPDPLVELFRFCIVIFRRAAGRRLNSRECHDVMCKIGDVVVSGGVRRSALLSLSNLSDQRMAAAKSGQWWETEPQRALANNSVAYTEKPEIGLFMKEWLNLYESKSGERGIFNREAATRKVRRSGRRKWENIDFGGNPCVEILLRSLQFCNLTEVVVREHDTAETLRDKVEVAAILGTYQSMLTDFRYLRSAWKNNVDEERLLGVSLTGIMDNRITAGLEGSAVLSNMLDDLRGIAVDTNAEWADMLGVPRSTAVTTVKPSGTVSQLVDAASGIHRRFARHYVRTVRNDKLDPLSAYLVEKGILHETDVSKAGNWVFSFPTQSPAHACVVDAETTAIEQLEHYLIYARYWAEHNVSVTIYVREHEWLDVGAWVYAHFDDINGISFLPYVEHVYKQAPYQAISEEEYARLASEFPAVDFSDYQVDEYEDNTQGSHMLACVGNACEVQ
jgi:ribonucleoside-diphosphate reductase alpha chain